MAFNSEDALMSDEKHYLVWRDPNGLRRIEVFTDQAAALRAYEHAENECCVLNGDPQPMGMEVCLFGSDSLATLVRTHASWFAPEAINLHGLCDQITTRNPPNPSATVKP